MFVSQDPIGYKGGMNLYEYVSDGPTDRTDPSGMQQQGTSPTSAAKLPIVEYNNNGTLVRKDSPLKKTVTARNGVWSLEEWEAIVTLPNLNFFAGPQTTYGGRIDAEFEINSKVAKAMDIKTYNIVVGQRFSFNKALLPDLYHYKLVTGANNFEPFPPWDSSYENEGDASIGRPAWTSRIATVSGDANIDVLLGVKCSEKKKWLTR